MSGPGSARGESGTMFAYLMILRQYLMMFPQYLIMDPPNTIVPDTQLHVSLCQCINNKNPSQSSTSRFPLEDVPRSPETSP